MHEFWVLLKIITEVTAQGPYFEEGQGARALSNLMHLSAVLEPAGHYCGHLNGIVGYYL